MKNCFYLAVLLLLIFSCGESKNEEAKNSLNPEIQKELNLIEEEWTKLTSDFAKWQQNFSTGKAEYFISRPLDSMKTASEKNSSYSAYLGDGWKQLYEEALSFPEKVETWNEANLKTIKSFNTEATHFSEWKNEAEGGNYNEKEISESIKYQKLKMEEGKLFFEDMKKTWEEMKVSDGEMIQSFRTIF